MKIKILLFTLAFGFFSCSSGPTIESIGALEKAVYNDATKKIDNQKANEYVAACETFAKANPTNEEAPKLLLKAAETARNINQFDKALALYDVVTNDFSTYAKAPQAMFLKAFTLDDSMGKKKEAKALYEAFLAKHPNDEFAESAKFMLENLYKSDEDIIKSFEANRKKAEGTEVESEE